MDDPIRFLLDENVSNAVIELLESRGHTVLLSRDVTAAGTPDNILAVLSAHESLVIVSHDKHFRTYSKLLPEHERKRFTQGAGRLQLEVPEVRARTRIEEELAMIEFAYHDCQRRGLPFRMTIKKSGVKIDNH